MEIVNKENRKMVVNIRRNEKRSKRGEREKERERAMRQNLT
jgi:hypothetical protein